MSVSKAGNPSLAHYVPELIVHHVQSCAERGDQTNAPPFHQDLYCVAVFADISGFTKLSEALGAEELGFYLNRYFEQLAKSFAKHSGDIIKFAGDALVALFWQRTNKDRTTSRITEYPSADDHSKEAQDVRVSMAELCQRAVMAATDIQTELQNAKFAPGVTFSVKQGIGMGKASLLFVGGVFGRVEYATNGPALQQAFNSEAVCRPGDIVIPNDVWDNLKDLEMYSVEPIGTSNANYRVSRISRQTNAEKRSENEKLAAPNFLPRRKDSVKMVGRDKSFMLAQSAAPSIRGKSSKLAGKDDAVNKRVTARHLRKAILQIEDMDMLKKFVPAAVVPHVTGDTTGSISELRIVSVVFIGLKLPTEELHCSDKNSLNRMHTAVRIVQAAIYEFEGSLNKYNIDDKGCTVLACFGLPPLAHENDPERAVLGALKVSRELKKASIETVIGVTSGVVFAGSLGAGTRKEYSVLGDVVNTSARLMQKSAELLLDEQEKPHILVDESTRHSAEGSPHLLWTERNNIELKGKQFPITAFEVDAKNGASVTVPLIQSPTEGVNPTLLEGFGGLDAHLLTQVLELCVTKQIDRGALKDDYPILAKEEEDIKEKDKRRKEKGKKDKEKDERDTRAPSQPVYLSLKEFAGRARIRQFDDSDAFNHYWYKNLNRADIDEATCDFKPTVKAPVHASKLEAVFKSKEEECESFKEDRDEPWSFSVPCASTRSSLAKISLYPEHEITLITGDFGSGKRSLLNAIIVQLLAVRENKVKTVLPTSDNRQRGTLNTVPETDRHAGSQGKHVESNGSTGASIFDDEYEGLGQNAPLPNIHGKSTDERQFYVYAPLPPPGKLNQRPLRDHDEYGRANAAELAWWDGVTFGYNIGKRASNIKLEKKVKDNSGSIGDVNNSQLVIIYAAGIPFVHDGRCYLIRQIVQQLCESIDVHTTEWQTEKDRLGAVLLTRQRKQLALLIALIRDHVLFSGSETSENKSFDKYRLEASVLIELVFLHVALKPTAIFIDKAHLASKRCWDMLYALAVCSARFPMVPLKMIIASHPLHESRFTPSFGPPSPGYFKMQTLLNVLHTSQRHWTIERIPALIRSLIGDRYPPELNALIAGMTGGNPGFVVKFLHTLQVTGVLCKDENSPDGGYLLDMFKTGCFPVPFKIQRFFATTIDRLDQKSTPQVTLVLKTAATLALGAGISGIVVDFEMLMKTLEHLGFKGNAETAMTCIKRLVSFNVLEMEEWLQQKGTESTPTSVDSVARKASLPPNISKLDVRSPDTGRRHSGDGFSLGDVDGNSETTFYTIKTLRFTTGFMRDVVYHRMLYADRKRFHTEAVRVMTNNEPMETDIPAFIPFENIGEAKQMLLRHMILAEMDDDARHYNYLIQNPQKTKPLTEVGTLKAKAKKLIHIRRMFKAPPAEAKVLETSQLSNFPSNEKIAEIPTFPTSTLFPSPSNAGRQSGHNINSSAENSPQLVVSRSEHGQACPSISTEKMGKSSITFMDANFLQQEANVSQRSQQRALEENTEHNRRSSGGSTERSPHQNHAASTQGSSFTQFSNSGYRFSFTDSKNVSNESLKMPKRSFCDKMRNLFQAIGCRAAPVQPVSPSKRDAFSAKTAQGSHRPNSANVSKRLDSGSNYLVLYRSSYFAPSACESPLAHQSERETLQRSSVATAGRQRRHTDEDLAIQAENESDDEKEKSLDPSNCADSIDDSSSYNTSIHPFNGKRTRGSLELVDSNGDDMPLVGSGLPLKLKGTPVQQYMQGRKEISPQDAVAHCLQHFERWNFDVVFLDKLDEGQCLLHVANFIFSSRSLLTSPCGPTIPLKEFNNFVRAVNNSYRSNTAYHNSIHAADVLQTSNTMLLDSVFRLRCHGPLTQLKEVAILVGAMVHDIDHPGMNDAVLKLISHPIAMENNEPILERHHAAAAFRLLKDPQNDILATFTRDQKIEFRKTVFDIVIATAMSEHFKFLDTLSQTISQDKYVTRISKDDANVYFRAIVKAADVSNPAKSFTIAREWSRRIISEFYFQGDIELPSAYQTSKFMDRTDNTFAQCQRAFIKFICRPLLDRLSGILPCVSVNWAANIDVNENFYSYLGDVVNETYLKPFYSDVVKEINKPIKTVGSRSKRHSQVYRAAPNEGKNYYEVIQSEVPSEEARVERIRSEEVIVPASCQTSHPITFQSQISYANFEDSEMGWANTVTVENEDEDVQQTVGEDEKVKANHYGVKNASSDSKSPSGGQLEKGHPHSSSWWLGKPPSEGSQNLSRKVSFQVKDILQKEGSDTHVDDSEDAPRKIQLRKLRSQISETFK